MDTVLLLGGRSFLGGHLCRALVERGYRVLLHSSTCTDFRNLRDFLPHSQVQPVVCPWGSRDELRRRLDRSHFVIHAGIFFSAQSLGQSKTFGRKLAELESFLSLLISSEIKKSVFVSVCGTVGAADGEADETKTLERPKGLGHLKHKLDSERMILRYAAKGLAAVVVNPTFYLGEYDCKPSSGEFVRFYAKFPFAAMKDRKLSIVDVEDVAVGTILALEKGIPGERYLLTEANTTVGELAARIRTLEGKSMPKMPVPEWGVYLAAYLSEFLNFLIKRPKPLVPLMGVELLDFGSQHFSSAKAKRDLGFVPGDAWAALERAHRWYRENGILS